MSDHRIDWTTVECVFVPLLPTPRCPHCYTDRKPLLRQTVTEREANGAISSVWRRCICSVCSRPWKLVMEPTALPDE